MEVAREAPARVRRVSRRLRCSLGVLALLVGCAPVNLAPPELGAAETRPLPWPERWGHFENQDRGIIHEDIRLITGWHSGRVPNEAQLQPDEIELEQAYALTSQGAESIAPEPEFEIGGGFVVRPIEGETAGALGEYRQHLTFVSAEYDETSGRLRLQRTWFTFAEPEARTPRGLAILMPGMFATPREVVDRAERGLLLRGWAVLRMLAPPSRMTERTVYTIPLVGDNTEVMREIAADLDNRVAECAYAVKAAAEHVVRGSADLAHAPRIILGMSGTGIALPTVVALEPEAYDAAVIVAGGANAFSIARRSSYREWIDSVGFEFTPREPTNAELTAIDARYLALSRLDGAHTASAMGDIPTLMLHGSADTAVPADAGELLWSRLQHAERWVMPVGHELVFAALPVRLVALLDWLESKTMESVQ